MTRDLSSSASAPERCELLQQELSAWMDGEAADSVALRTHRATCPRCIRFLAYARELRAELRSLRHEVAPLRILEHARGRRLLRLRDCAPAVARLAAGIAGFLAWIAVASARDGDREADVAAVTHAWMHRLESLPEGEFFEPELVLPERFLRSRAEPAEEDR